MKNPFRRADKAAAVPPMPRMVDASGPMTAVVHGQKTLTPDGRLVTEFSPPIQQMLRLYGVGSSYAQMYARQPNVRACVDCVAREAAGLTLKMYEKVPEGLNVPDSRIEIDEHDMAQLLDEPTPGSSNFRFWYATFADIEVYDRAIWLKIRSRGPGTKPDGLLRIPPMQLFPQRDPLTGQVTHWWSSRGLRVENDDLVVFWGYDPDINHGFVPIMETLRRLLAEEWAAGMNREGMWKNSLRKDGIIEQDIDADKMSDTARDSFLLDVADVLSGQDGSGLPLMLEPGQHWKDSVWSPREMEYLNARRLSRLETAAAFHLPPAMVSASINGVEPDDKTLEVFYTSSLPPRLQRVEDEIEAQLLPDFDPMRSVRRRRYVEFNIDAKLRGSFEKQAAIAATAVGGPFITVNEMRARLNLPPIPGGDDIFVPLNSARGGGPQGSPQAPTATPAAGIEPAGTTPGGGTGPAPAPADTGKELRDAMAAADEKAQLLKDAADHAAFMKETRARYEERHVVAVQKFFDRQRNAYVGGKEFKSERWDAELTDDLMGVALETCDKFGSDAAERIKGSWSLDRTANYLRTASENAAKRINLDTAQMLAQEDADPDKIWSKERATEVATTRTTFVMNWAVQEAAHQNGI